MAKISDTAQARSRKFTLQLILMVACITLFLVIMTGLQLGFLAAFLVIGLLPGMVSLAMDRRSGKFASKTITAFNLAGLVPHVAGMLASGSPNHTAASMLLDFYIWFWVYSFAAFGMGLVHFVPHVVQLYYEIRAQYIHKKLSYFQERLVDEWGEAITRRPGQKATEKAEAATEEETEEEQNTASPAT